MHNAHKTVVLQCEAVPCAPQPPKAPVARPVRWAYESRPDTPPLPRGHSVRDSHVTGAWLPRAAARGPSPAPGLPHTHRAKQAQACPCTADPTREAHGGTQPIVALLC